MSTKIHDYKYLHLLIMLYITLILATHVLVYKMVALGSIIEPGAALIFPAAYIIADIIAEVYGYQISRRLIWYTLICDLVFCLLVTAIVYLPPPANWGLQKDYVETLGRLMRLEVSGSLALVVGAFVNIYSMSKWKVLTKGRLFWLRSMGASGIGEAALTITGYPLAFAGGTSVDKIFYLIIAAWVFKFFCTLIFIYPASIVARVLKNVEQVDVYDYEVDFNPFKLD